MTKTSFQQHQEERKEDDEGRGGRGGREVRSGKKHSLKAVQLSTTAKLYVNKTAYRREVETSQGQKPPHDPMTAGGRGMGGRGSRGTGGSLGQPPASWVCLHGSDFLLHIFKELQQIRVKKPPVYPQVHCEGFGVYNSPCEPKEEKDNDVPVPGSCAG